MSTIILAQYNNYYNRIIKQSTLDTFTSLSNMRLLTDINFNPHDGVTTRLVINWDDNFIPDYLVECDTDTIVSRWFITDMKRERSGQYTISLKRDLIADFYDETMDATTFISRGFLDSGNPLIFNPEGITVNQIKREEMPLRDSTRCGWIVGYVAPNLEDSTVELTYPQEIIPDISTFEYSEYIGKTLNGILDESQSYYMIYGRLSLETEGSGRVKRFLNNKGVRVTGAADGNLPVGTPYVRNMLAQTVADLSIPMNNNVFETLLANNVSNDELSEIFKLENKVYKDGDTYKQLVISELPASTTTENNVKITEYPNIIEAVETALINAGCELTAVTSALRVVLTYSAFTINFITVAAPFTTANITFKSTNRRLYDAPYKMFCMPVSNAVCRYGEIEFSMEKERQLQIAASIATGLGANLYDIQLLPYCPIEDQFGLLTDVNGNEYLGGTEDIDYSLVKDAADTVIGMLFWCPRASFTTNIITRFLAYPDLNYNNPIEFKVGNETNYIRMVSPNYANYEDINYFMNYGVDYINIDCTYKPITPYVKLNINYKGLYGKDFDDNRGLVLGGDFSLPIMSDAWINYTIQNKNYADIFDRETQHLEYQHRWNMATTITGAISGTAMAGIMGGAVGGVGGAIGGAVGGAAAGITDAIATGALHGEAMDYRKDMYQMNLQNIQALPQGLVKTSAFNYNSKIWPFLEFYSCTDTEKELLRNKIKYTGMKVEAIGKISDYLNPADQTYIQGNLIRINIDDDYHMAQALNQELNIGVYI